MKFQVALKSRTGLVASIPMTDIHLAIAIARNYAEDNEAFKEGGIHYVFSTSKGVQVACVEYLNEELGCWKYATIKIRQQIEEEQEEKDRKFNETKIIHFNTGRSYTIQGQRIIAVRKGKWVAFNDLDRGVYGIFEFSESLMFGQRSVMEKYDKDKFEWLPNDPHAVDLLKRVRELTWEELEG